jgi:ketosteroid isomerase-like protein
LSHENVETFRETLKAFDRGDREAWLSLHDPEHEVIPGGFWPETTPIQGREATWEFYALITQTLQPQSFLDEFEVESAGPDKILVHQHGPYRGQASGAQVDLDFWMVGSFRAGKVVRDEWFATREEALEAAGLQE